MSGDAEIETTGIGLESGTAPGIGSAGGCRSTFRSGDGITAKLLKTGSSSPFDGTATGRGDGSAAITGNVADWSGVVGAATSASCVAGWPGAADGEVLRASRMDSGLVTLTAALNPNPRSNDQKAT